MPNDHSINNDDDREREQAEEEEEEEEDVDFNPFLKETMPSPEASSSLSSETDATAFPPPANASCKKKSGEEVIQTETNNDAVLNEAEDQEEDAIWKRTRAKYSLERFTLDQLESFLQETDDEGDLRYVDEQEEYRRFLAAVLNGDEGVGDCDGGGGDDGNGGDDDDDVDFEIELEELLDSDVEHERKVRPETRLCSRRSKVSRVREGRKKKKKDRVLEHVKRPLRPLVPILPIVGGFAGNVGDFHAVHGRSGYAGPVGEGGLAANAFTPQQFGQLYCLIYEHVQLLIQVFSLCVLDPAKQHIAAQVQGLIAEMLRKRDEVMASNRRHDNVSDNGQMASLETGGSSLLPCGNGPLMSVLDVAPLHLVGRYMDDVSNGMFLRS